MKKLFNLLLLTGILCFIGVVKGSAFNGSTLTDGGQYYLYNLYQAKFLSYGNTWGTQVSLDNRKPLLCTINASGSGYTINTHYSLTDKAYKASYDNYICIVDGTPVVNANWGDADDTYTHRDAQVFSFTKRTDGDYNITYDNSGTTMALMFSAGTACTVADITTDFDNRTRSEWRLVSADEYNTYIAKNRFTVAALNVDGMPKKLTIAGVYDYDLNPDGKEGDGATAMGTKLKTAGYDVVGVSEDFNFHSELWNAAWNDGVTDAANGIWSYNATTHRGDINLTLDIYAKFVAQTSPLFNTDGLCLFYKTANVDQTTLENSESWTAWNKHYGYIDNGADGLIDKGYRYYTVKLKDDTEFDVYILHMDAETDADDNDARASQLAQLAAAIKASNNGRPVIVMGDTNCRYTRDRLQTLFISSIEEDPRFTVEDPWIEFGRNGIYPACDGTNDHSIMVDTEGYLKGEVVDKVFYINNKESNIRFSALSYAQDLSFVNDAGESLSDHKPAVVEFEYHTYNPAIDDTEKTIEEYKWVGVDPVTGGTSGSTAGGTYYIYHPNSGKFLTNDGTTLGLDYTTTTTWTITYKSTSSNVYTVNMKSNNGGYSFNLAKSSGSATPTLRISDDETTQMSAASNSTYASMNPFKIHRTATPARYFNYCDDDGFTGTKNDTEQNDWVFIPVDQYEKQHPQDYIENGVHYYKGIYTSGNTPTIAATMPTNTSTIATEQAYDFDFTYATGDGFSSITVDVTANPNAIIYAKKGKVTNDKNVVIAETDKCANLVITDGYPLYIPSKFIATNATYVRESTASIGTLILPYAPISKSGYKYYVLNQEDVNESATSAVGGTITFKEIEGAPQPNTPYLYSNSTGKNFDMSTTNAAVYAAANVPNVCSVATQDNNWNMVGVYEKTTVFADENGGDNYSSTYSSITNYKTADANSYYIKDVSHFAKVNGYFNNLPFRAYFSTTAENAVKGISFAFKVAPMNIVDVVNAINQANSGEKTISNVETIADKVLGK